MLPKWSEDRQYIIGRTLTGRATIDTLQMNLLQRINLRRVLLSLGKRPAKII